MLLFSVLSLLRRLIDTERPATMGMSSKTEKLDLLFCSVVSKMADELAASAEALGSANPGPESACENVYRIAHSLHGAGTLYGYPSVSELGASLEKLADALRADRVARTPAVGRLISECAAALRQVAGPDRTQPRVLERIVDLAWKCECCLRGTLDPSST